jgi:hypothetical protein
MKAAPVSEDEKAWRLELIRRLSWGQLIEHITINHLWRSQHGTSPADLYAIPTERHA